jgi:hypothetical protein
MYYYVRIPFFMGGDALLSGLSWSATPPRTSKRESTPFIVAFFPFSLPGGDEGIRTPGLLHAKQALSQLSHTPVNNVDIIPHGMWIYPPPKSGFNTIQDKIIQDKRTLAFREKPVYISRGFPNILEIPEDFRNSWRCLSCETIIASGALSVPRDLRFYPANTSMMTASGRERSRKGTRTQPRPLEM